MRGGGIRGRGWGDGGRGMRGGAGGTRSRLGWRRGNFGAIVAGFLPSRVHVEKNGARKFHRRRIAMNRTSFSKRRSPFSLLAFLQVLSDSFAGGTETETDGYRKWRCTFSTKRVRLLLGITILYYTSFIVPRVLYELLRGHSLPQWIWVDAWVLLSLLLFSMLARLPLASCRLSLPFLGITFSINIVEQMVETYLGGASFDLVDDIFHWTLSFFVQATLVPVAWPLHLLSQGLTYMSYLGIKLAIHQPFVPEAWTFGSWISTLFLLSSTSTLAVLLYERAARSQFHAHEKLEAAYQKLAEEQNKLELERKRSEELLRNILPASIARRLKSGDATIADRFDGVTVLFADIVGFTEIAAQIDAIELVEMLNRIFSSFDRLAERYKLEKIKTIGDAYMVVAGLPEDCPNCAGTIADMALDMRDTMSKIGRAEERKLQVRIGFHYGPVVAGVIGLKKFAYDLWGDTVNTASRLESHGIPGEIQTSEATYERLQHHYRFEKRGDIPLKGKGTITTYLLKGRRSHLLKDAV